jgi:hypothetical protein
MCEKSLTCYKVAFNDPKVCSGHGACIRKDICDCNYGYRGNQCEIKGKADKGMTKNLPGSSCTDILQSNMNATDGKYWIKLDRENGVFTSEPIQVWCDMTGGGYTMIIRRSNSTTSFSRPYADYVQGFGDVDGNHWIGLDTMYMLTEKEPMEMSIEAHVADGSPYFQIVCMLYFY